MKEMVKTKKLIVRNPKKNKKIVDKVIKMSKIEKEN